MKRGVASTAALVALLSPAAAWWTVATEDHMISDRRTIELARRACEGKVTIPAGVEPLVTRTAATIVVTFPTRLAPGSRGADYHARVTLDAESGRVIEVLGGS